MVAVNKMDLAKFEEARYECVGAVCATMALVVAAAPSLLRCLSATAAHCFHHHWPARCLTHPAPHWLPCCLLWCGRREMQGEVLKVLKKAGFNEEQRKKVGPSPEHNPHAAGH